jgi:hypothetical protein
MARAPPILPRAETSACPAVGQLGNRLDDLLGKRARTFCRYLHRGPSPHVSQFCPTICPVRPAKLVIRVEVQLPEGVTPAGAAIPY